MSLTRILRQYILPVTLGAALAAGGCAPITPEQDEVAQATVDAGGKAVFQDNLTFIAENSESLTDKIEPETVRGEYTVIQVDYPTIMYDDGEEGYDIRITRIVALQSGLTDVENYETFLYFGDRPIMEGGRIRITYYPVIPGNAITNDDIMSVLGEQESVSVYRVIEGFHGPYSITGIVAYNEGVSGIEYISPGE
ncbi:TPA: hypothetical protein HA239_00405 [Candidatus Woesearchaeota archaeon]|nr:hypothetical protein QT06_C0001G0161 [archaeon GW2011_AR15]HIH40860.1 hypothetical protein [Candidatus Woesearchaeota archaeon]